MPAGLPFLLDPGTAPKSEILRVFSGLSQLFQLLGGTGLVFQTEEVRRNPAPPESPFPMAETKVVRGTLNPVGTSEEDQLLWETSTPLFALLINHSERVINLYEGASCADVDSAAMVAEAESELTLQPPSMLPADQREQRLAQLNHIVAGHKDLEERRAAFVAYVRSTPDIAAHLGATIVSLSDLTMNYGLEISAIQQ